MSNEFYAGFEKAPIPTINDLNLLEVMDICSNLYPGASSRRGNFGLSKRTLFRNRRKPVDSFDFGV